MAKLPGIADLGATPTADPTRPVGTYDASPVGRAGAALAEGGRALGQGITKAGEGIGALELDKSRWEYAQAHADQLTNKIELTNEVQQDTDYPTMSERYSTRIAEVNRNAAGRISDPRMRERFVSDSKPDVAQFNSSVLSHARKLNNDADIAYTQEQGNKFIDQGVSASDDATQRQVIDTHNQLVDGLVAKGAITAPQAVAMKQAWAHQYATASALRLADTDPDAAVNMFRAKPGSTDGVTARILQIEGSGKNSRSSATGAGQFIDSTWLDVLKRNRPDLAEGRSDADLLALRADRQLGRDMTAAYARENAATLQKNGIEATPGNTYLAHFLGPAGAVAVLQAKPNTPVLEALASAKGIGPAKAQAMVDANPTILGGQLAGSVKQWADTKMGGAVPGGGSIYDILRPDVREQILAHAQAAQHKRDVNDLTAFKGRYQDTTTEAMTTGTVAKPMGVGEFVAALGVDQGPKAFKEYQAQLQLGADVSKVAALDPDEQQRLLQSYAPKPGAEGYAEQEKRFSVISKAVAQIGVERGKDPAAFAIARLPVVGEAHAKFTATAADPTASLEAKQAAARDYASKMDMEQARIGVPAEQRSLVSQDYIDRFNAKLTKPAAAGGTVNVAGMIENEAKIWGDEAWPKVWAKLGKGAAPVAMVIGNGVKPAAAQILTEFANTKLGDIANDQDEVKLKSIKEEVRKTLKPFIGSLLGTEMAQPEIDAYQAAGEKLTAYYVRGGDAADVAAGKAFDQLLGHKYDFTGGSYRVPKDIPFTPAEIAAGVQAARFKLREIGVNPARDTIGGLSAEYLTGARPAQLARDGKFVTAGGPVQGDKGVWLVYQDQVVRGSGRGADGKPAPLFLSWSQLAQMGKDLGFEAERNISGAPGGPEMFR